MKDAINTDDFIAYVDIDLKEIIPDFLSNRQQDVEKLRLAAKQNDTESVANVAHNLKGIGGSYGFDEITRLGIAIEKALQTNNMEYVNASIEHLSYYLTHVKISYQQMD